MPQQLSKGKSDQKAESCETSWYNLFMDYLKKTEAHTNDLQWPPMRYNIQPLVPFLFKQLFYFIIFSLEVNTFWTFLLSLHIFDCEFCFVSWSCKQMHLQNDRCEKQPRGLGSETIKNKESQPQKWMKLELWKEYFHFFCKKKHKSVKKNLFIYWKLSKQNYNFHLFNFHVSLCEIILT